MPEQLQRLFADALAPNADKSLVDAAIERETAEIAELKRAA
jgi:hypothetical protein